MHLPNGDQWQRLAKPLAMQAGLFSTLGAGLYVLRRLSQPIIHPVVAAHTTLVESKPALAAAVSQLGALEDTEALICVVDKVNRILEMDTQGGLAAQWHISRLSAEVVRDAEAMCRTPSAARSDDVFRAMLTCKEEVIPQIRGQLDDLLHNHLLARPGY